MYVWCVLTTKDEEAAAARGREHERVERARGADVQQAAQLLRRRGARSSTARSRRSHRGASGFSRPRAAAASSSFVVNTHHTYTHPPPRRMASVMSADAALSLEALVAAGVYDEDPPLLWLWRRPVATAPIRPLAWEPHLHMPREGP